MSKGLWLAECDDFILFPGLCDRAEHGVSFWDRKLKAFYSALASAPLSDDLFAIQ